VSAGRPRIAWVTNDLPPHSGGIQQFVANLLTRTADTTTLVLGPAAPAGRSADADRFDASHPGRTVRSTGRILPTAATLRRLVPELTAHRPDVVVLGSVWPLGRLAGRLRAATGAPVLGISHGAEAGLAAGPARPLLRAVARDVDLLTVISDHTAAAIGPVLGDAEPPRLSPGVDPDRFAAAAHRTAARALRERWGVPADAPVVGCVARLVPRKGQDVLLDVWPQVRATQPAARLVIVGEGPLRRRLTRRAATVEGAHVVGPVAWEDLPAAYAALDVFAMPVRTRLAGLDVEGLGISLLEAQAAGLPVLAGRSGGAPETVTDPRVGRVVDGRDRTAVAAALVDLLADDVRAAAATHGPHAAQAWSWDAIAARFDALTGALAARPR